MSAKHNFEQMKQRAGVHFPAGYQMTMDAQPSLVTTMNGGIPAYMTQYFDQTTIEVLFAPMKAAEIVGTEKKMGDWTTKSMMFPFVEHAGQVSSYGDYNNNGSTSANVNFPQRQSYHYQTITQWGDMEADLYGDARLAWTAELNQASILTLNKFQNKSYFFGIAGLENYGLLNDPALSAPITPAAQWSLSGTDSISIYGDILSLFKQLQSQADGLVEMTDAMTLALSPLSMVELGKTNQYNVQVREVLKQNFPNMRIVAAPEYTTTAGELVQLIIDKLEGQPTAVCGFTEKLRAHPIIREISSFKQKKSQGTFGTIIYRPFAIAQMLGV